MTNEEYTDIVAKNIRRLLQEHEKTFIDLARDLKINKSTISSWVNGHRTPKMDKIDLLCKYFRCDREDIMEPYPEIAKARLSLEERLVINAYRNAPTHIQNAIKTMLKVGKDK